jgi:hypothetical protein
MDLDKIKSVVLTQLTDTNGLYSLKLQNHIYGCFIIMEDIAQSNVDVSGNIISTSKFSFDLDRQFEEIGLRYGFAMDTKLALNMFNPEYKETWLKYFNDIDLQREIEEVDKIEDCLIEVIQNTVKPEDGFFISSLESGSLPQEWVEKVFALLSSPSSPLNDSEEDLKKTAISHAITEKPIRAKKRLSTTRRAHSKPLMNKKSLAKTRRHK